MSWHPDRRGVQRQYKTAGSSHRKPPHGAPEARKWGATPPADNESVTVLIKLLRAHLGPYSRPITLLVLLQLVSTIAALYLPALNADIIDNGVVKGDTGHILALGGVMIGVTVVQALCSVAAVFFGARTAMAIGRDIRAAVFDRVQSFSARELNSFGAPSLITRTTNDVQQVQMLVLMGFTLMVAAPIMCFGGILMALNQDVPLSALLLVVVPVLGGVVTVLVRLLGRSSAPCRPGSTR